MPTLLDAADRCAAQTQVPGDYIKQRVRDVGRNEPAAAADEAERPDVMTNKEGERALPGRGASEAAHMASTPATVRKGAPDFSYHIVFLFGLLAPHMMLVQSFLLRALLIGGTAYYQVDTAPLARTTQESGGPAAARRVLSGPDEKQSSLGKQHQDEVSCAPAALQLPCH